MISKIYKGSAGDIHVEERGSEIDKEVWEYLTKQIDPRKDVDAFVVAYNLIIEDKNLKDPQYITEILRLQEKAEKQAIVEQKAKDLLSAFLKNK